MMTFHFPACPAPGPSRGFGCGFYEPAHPLSSWQRLGPCREKWFQYHGCFTEGGFPGWVREPRVAPFIPGLPQSCWDYSGMEAAAPALTSSRGSSSGARVIKPIRARWERFVSVPAWLKPSNDQEQWKNASPPSARAGTAGTGTMGQWDKAAGNYGNCHSSNEPWTIESANTFTSFYFFYYFCYIFFAFLHLYLYVCAYIYM